MRFIALHIIKVKIKPEAPTRQPETTNTVLLIAKPAKAAANRDYHREAEEQENTKGGSLPLVPIPLTTRKCPSKLGHFLSVRVFPLLPLRGHPATPRKKGKIASRFFIVATQPTPIFLHKNKFSPQKHKSMLQYNISYTGGGTWRRCHSDSK